MRCEVKGHNCRNMRPNVAKLPSGMDCSVVPMKRGNARGGRGAGHPLRNGGQLKGSSVKYGEAYTGTKSKDQIPKKNGGVRILGVPTVTAHYPGLQRVFGMS